MARLRATIAKETKYYSIIEDYYRNDKRTTKTLLTLGNESKITSLATKENLSVEEYLNNCLKNSMKSHPESVDEEIIIKKYTNKQIPMEKTNKFNVGYLFLKNIYYVLSLDKIVNSIAFGFDLNEVLSHLVYSKIIFPSSKLKTYELSKNFIETPRYNLVDLYRRLSYINKNLEFIQRNLYNNSKAVVDRKTQVCYYDCTNYYFDIYEEENLRKYTGNVKDKKGKPAVGMGLFLDGTGYPIAMNIYPNSDNESTTLLPLQKKIIGIDPITNLKIGEFDLENSNTIIWTDAAMCTDDIKLFNVKDGRAFVITQFNLLKS